MQDRLKSMKQGEVAIYNSITKTFFHLRENGSFLVNCSGKIEGDVEITGNLDVGGNVAVAGNLTAQTITCDEIIVNGVPSSTHVHGGVSTGSGTTAGPQ